MKAHVKELIMDELEDNEQARQEYEEWLDVVEGLGSPTPVMSEFKKEQEDGIHS